MASDLMMDVFGIEPDSPSELNQHPWEHRVFVVSGLGEIRGDGETVALRPGEVIFIPPDDEHRFRDVGTDSMVFVCSVPRAALTA